MAQSHTLITAGGVKHTVCDEFVTGKMTSSPACHGDEGEASRCVFPPNSEMSPNGTASGADALSCTQLPASGVSPAGGAFSRYHARADSLCKSAKSMEGKPGVVEMRLRAKEARHAAIAADLQGRV